MENTRTGMDRDGPWVALICGYFAFQAVYRRVMGGSLGLDEAQIILEAQGLEWGYGSQPPLYAWLQWGSFQVLGDPLLAMALLKNALLATTLLALYALFRQAHRPRTAGLAAFGLMLVPQIAWESQRALTHSVLVTCLAALTYLAFWTRVLAARPYAWLLFGLLAGLGMLAKLNYVVVPLALVSAALSMSEFRARMRPGGLALATAIAAALLVMPFDWMRRHPDLATSSSFKFQRAAEEAPLWQAAGSGLVSVIMASALFVALAAVILAVIRYRYRCHKAPAEPDLLSRFLWRTIFAGVLVVLVVVLATGTTNAKDRWMQPVLFAAAPTAIAWLLARVTPAGERALRNVIVGLAILVIVVLPVHHLYGEPGKPARGAAPIAEIAPRIDAEFPGLSRVITDKEWLAGNLFYRNPDWTARQIHFAGPDAVPPDGALLAWSEGQAGDGAALLARLTEASGTELVSGDVVTFAEPYGLRPDFTFAINVMRVIPAPDG